MMTTWHSLYLSSEQSQTLIDTIIGYLEKQHYTIYHPFGALPGMSYPRTVKTFLAKPQANWSRLLIDADGDAGEIDSFAQYLSKTVDCLSVRLEGKIALIHAFRGGELLNLADWAKTHLKDANIDISSILSAEFFDLPLLSEGKIGDVPIEALPDDIQKMAGELNINQANKLFEKLSNRLLKTVGRHQACSLINIGAEWDSQGGQYIRAVMTCLTIPDNWRRPDFSTLRTAYAVTSRKAEGMTTLFPGDTEALKIIPDALNYHPVYGGRIEG